MPSYPPLSNPYSQKKPTLGALLKSITKNAGVPTLSMVQSIQQQFTQQSSKWTLEMAQDLSSKVVKLFNPSHGNYSDTRDAQGSVAVLNLLVSSMAEWDDSICYAVLVDTGMSQDVGKNLLNLLISLAAGEDTIKHTAIVGISIALRALDRVQQVTVLDPNTIDTAWWLTGECIDPLARTSIEVLINLTSGTEREMMSDGMIVPSMEQRKLAATAILAHLMRYHQGCTSEYFSEDILKTLSSKLIQEAQWLVQSNLPPSANSITLSTAIQSLTLLCLVQWACDVNLAGIDQCIQSPTLVENMVHFIFPSALDESHTHRPQWTWSNNDSHAQSIALDLVRCWRICNNASWKLFLQQESLWENFVERAWCDMISNEKSEQTPTNLQKLFLLHSSSRLQTRRIFSRTIKHLEQDTCLNVDPCQALVRLLCNLSKDEENTVGIYSARILFLFLFDRKSIHTNDDLSRALWNAVDYELVEACLMGTLERASTDDVYQPRLLVLLDLLGVIFSSVEFCDATLNQLGAQSLERLIYLVKPKEVKIDFLAMLDDDSEDENTPAANNLSRLDETSICMEQEEEKVGRGIDSTVRLSAALVLSRLGYHSSFPSDESIGVLVSRIRKSVMDFLSTPCNTNPVSESPRHSLDSSKRFFRLQTTTATADNEDYIASILHTRQINDYRQLGQMKRDMESQKHKLLQASKREEGLRAKQKKYENMCRSQTLVLQRELAKQEERLTEDARVKLAIHVSERSKAETRCVELHEKLSGVEFAVKEAQEKEAARMTEVNQLKQTLSEVHSRASELESENLGAKRQLRDESIKCSELSDQITGMSNEMETLRGRHSELEGEASFFRDDNANLLNNLEDLFADMISLAQVYQHLETEKNSSVERSTRDLDALRKKLSNESGRNFELEEKVSTLKTENEKLFRKLAKYKDRLEEERRSREEEKQRRKRSGPVSYINQLHESQRPSRNDKDKESQRSSRIDRDKSYRTINSRQEKENSSSYYAYASSASQRRKNYC
ncbi:unnamed protein product [Cylindrotheca closterium]|uniref:Uncharacterized protein n=1 Tax=Cylindrotheca closterium TaxID=2856 RepID=A0AAD2CPY8_9STRA|nr:unnamed protein product [Cylindrotheca closterium]